MKKQKEREFFKKRLQQTFSCDQILSRAFVKFQQGIGTHSTVGFREIETTIFDPASVFLSTH